MTISVYNQIWQGYQFNQDFIVAVASLPAGAQLRADVTYATRAGAKNIIPVTFSFLGSDTWRFQLTDAQTLDMAPGTIQFDPVVFGMGIEDFPLGVRVTVMVAKSLTTRTEP